MTQRKHILVTGATGTIGRPLTLRLAGDPGVHVRALVRDPGRAADLAEAGVELVAGDFADDAALARAMTGIDTLVLVTAANPHASEQAHAAITAAKRSGVRKIVRLSAIKADPEGPTDNTRQHGRTEAEIRASGLAYVLLRPAAFLQNLLWSAPRLLGEGRLYEGFGSGRIALVDTRDVVDALASAATHDTFDGKTFELTGPQALAYDEVAAALGRALARSITYVPVTPEQAGEAMRGLGADAWTAQLVTDYARAYGSGWGDTVTDNVRVLTGHAARDIDAFAREVLVPAVTR